MSFFYANFLVVFTSLLNSKFFIKDPKYFSSSPSKALKKIVFIYLFLAKWHFLFFETIFNLVKRLKLQIFWFIFDSYFIGAYNILIKIVYNIGAEYVRARRIAWTIWDVFIIGIIARCKMLLFFFFVEIF